MQYFFHCFRCLAEKYYIYHNLLINIIHLPGLMYKICQKKYDKIQQLKSKISKNIYVLTKLNLKSMKIL